MDEQTEKLLRKTWWKGAHEEDIALAKEKLNQIGINGLSHMVHYPMRYNRSKGRSVMTVQISIDGARYMAERTGEYMGQTPQEWCGKNGQWVDVWVSDEPPVAARCGVYRKGFEHPVYAVAKFESYAVRNKDGKLSQFWSNMGDLMISKCFSEDTEILTENGFERFSDVTGRILQVTDSGLSPCDARPYSQEYSGDMICASGTHLDFRVTPNHDMITTDGKIEAGKLYNLARSRAKFWIPRCIEAGAGGIEHSSESISLAAAYLCDGSDYNKTGFIISVSKDYKIDTLDELGLHKARRIKSCKGNVGYIDGRRVESSADQVSFIYDWDSISWICGPGKRVDIGKIAEMSISQASTFVDSMVEFDGHEQETGVRRFYASSDCVMRAMEVACVASGQCVSQRKHRGDGGMWVTVSSRSKIPVRRWVREYRGKGGNDSNRTGLHIEQSSGAVWCVTVPSGEIIVRRGSFSMRCGNCAESLAFRKAFPDTFAGVYTNEEMQQAGFVPPSGLKDLLAFNKAVNEAKTIDELSEIRPPKGLSKSDLESARELWRVKKTLLEDGIDPETGEVSEQGEFPI